MKKTKFISAILAAAQIFTLSVIPGYAEASTEITDYSIAFYNDGAADEWENLNTSAGTVSQIEEEGNKIVRLKVNSFTWTENVPRMRIDLGENRVKFEEGKVITIETKIRAKTLNGGDARISFKYNTDYKCDYEGNTGDTRKFNMSGNYLTLAGFAWNSASGYSAFMMPVEVLPKYAYQTNFQWQKLNPDNAASELYENILDGETWIDLKIELDHAGNKADYTVSWDGKSKEFSTTNLGNYSAHDYLETLDIDNTVKQIDHIDVDYIKVKTYEKNAEAKLLGATDVEGVNEIRLDDSFNVKFNLPIDAETLTTETVKLINTDTDEEVVINTPVYNEDDLTVTVTPAEDLPHGNYKISLTEDIKTTDIYPELDTKWIPLKATELSFRYYATNPPDATDVEIIGEAVVGGTILGRYTYKSEDNVAESKDGSVYKWYISENAEGEYLEISGESSKTLVITEDYSNKFIKFGVIPKDETGFEGTEVLSEAYAAPSEPFAEDALVSGNAVVGQTLVISYNFMDDNGDKEGASEYQWYISDNSTDGFVPIDGANAKTLKLDESYSGKYIKAAVTPVSLNIPYRGETVETEVKGPVAENLIDGTNLAGVNGDLEMGDLTNWKFATSSERVNSLKVLNKEENPDDVYEGNYALEVGSIFGQWGFYGIKMEANTAYLVSMMAKSPSGAATGYLYSWPIEKTGGTRAKDYDALNYSAAGKAGSGITAGSGNSIGTDWTEVTDVMVAYNEFTPNVALVSWSQKTKIIVDDLYVGKLAVANIDVTLPESVNIPSSGETKIAIPTPEVTNQLGTGYGLTDASVRFEVAEGTQGVRIETDENGKNTIVITNYASVGTLNIKAICDPYSDTGSVKYAGVEPYETIIPIELKGSGSTDPRIIEADLSGDVEEGSVLTMNYTFYQLYGDADKSEISWWYSETKDGTYEQIEGSFGKIYIVPVEKAGGYFKVKIVPKTETDEGTAVWTNIVGAPEAPVASEVSISGEAFIGRTLTGSYNYTDFNRDAEGISTFKWLRADTENGTYSEIEGANGTTYILTEADKDKFIKFEVTPVSDTAPEKGEAVRSDAFKGPKAPEARNVKITKSGNKYIGSYEYYQEAGAPEGKTTYKWIVDGKVAATTISYIPDFSGTKNVTFEVTPVSSEEPKEGKPSGTEMSINKTTTSGGGGGASGGSPSMIGGLSGSATVTQPVVPSITIPETEKDTTIAGALTDIKGHWGYDAIYWAVNGRIMEKKTDTTFEPDGLATRREIITYMAKILGWEASEYQGIFADVEGEFGNTLQTFVDKGVISVDVNFRPDDNLTRQELCKIFAISLGITSENADSTIFDDNSDVGEWAIPHINAVYEAGLVKGVGNNRFSPRGNVTRAQMAALLQRVSERIAE